MGGLFEEVVEANGTVKQRSHVGDFLIDERSGPVETPAISRRYLIRDNLGSVSVILDDNLADGLASSILSNVAYEAFGAEYDSTRFNAGTDVANMTRGYTDHEQFDDLGILHMNGRIYDADLGRFLSADPLVSHPYFSQSYNRYSYVMNNPLSATDPSGFEVQYIPVPVYIGGDDDSCFDGRTPADGPTVRGCSGDCNPQSNRGFTGVRSRIITEDRVAYRSDQSTAYLNKLWSVWGEGRSSVLEGIKPGTPPPMLKAPAAVAPDAVAGGEVGGGSSFWDNPGAHLPSLPQGVVDSIAGFGDGVSSTLTFGLYSTADARADLGVGSVNEDSGYYNAGQISGVMVAGALVTTSTARLAAGRVVSNSMDDLFRAGRIPKASELAKYAEGQGWRPVQTSGGPLKYVDVNGIPRVTIKQGSSRAPGSGGPHVELKNASGQRVDPFGNPVTRKSLGNHTSIYYDL